MNANLVKIFAIVIIILLALLLWLGLRWLRFLHTPLLTASKPAAEFVLQPNTSVKALARELHQRGILAKPTAFILWVRLKGQSRNLQAGEYRIEPGTTPVQLLNKLVSGQVILYSFTIVPGWTLHKLLVALEEDPHLMHTLQNLSDAAIMQRIGHPGEKPEGRFFPETYKFPRNYQDVDILQQAYILMQQNLQQMWINRDTAIPYQSVYEALIVASVIEKEAALREERPIISGIIMRRLQKHMYLQLDPTVIYGLGAHFKGELTAKDLKKDTPYNTYIYKGLPPTPICMPSIAAIYAALHPAAGNMLYFVAKGDGSHEFSATLQQHDKAIKKYQLNKK